MDTFSICILILVIFPFALFIIRIILLSWKNVLIAQRIKRAMEEEEERRRANAVSTISNGQTGSNSEGGGSGAGVPKDMDLPPAYDEVMQTYIDAKLRMQAAEEGAVGGMSSAISTNTLETNVDSAISAMDVTIIGPAEPSTATTTTRTTVSQITTTTTSYPPSYESTFGANNNNVTRDSIV